MKKVIIVGATGMIGSLILEECLKSDTISNIIAISRKKLNNDHPKLRNIIHSDFSNFDSILEEFKNIDIGFFTIGVYSGKVKDDVFKKITVDFPIKFGTALQGASPNSTLCFLSGAGADRTEQSKMAFAKFKGMAENQISAIGFNSWYSFRPSYIYPVSPRQEPNIMYRISRFMYPLISLFGKNMSIKSTELAKAMVQVGLNGNSNEILENQEIHDQL